MKLFLILLSFCSIVIMNAQEWEQVGQEIFGEFENDFTGVGLASNNSGNRIAVYDSFIDGQVNGRVRVFNEESGSWTQLGGDIIGLSAMFNESYPLVRMNATGTRIVIGNANHNFIGDNSGGVRVFEFQNGGWNQLGNTIYGQEFGEYFGVDVGINGVGNKIVVGATRSNTMPAKSGQVKVFEYINTDWTQTGQTLVGTSSEDDTGASVSINEQGNIIAFASPNNSEAGFRRGKVDVYEQQGTSWEALGAPIFGQNDNDQIGAALVGPKQLDLNANGDRIAISSTSYSQVSSFGQVQVLEFSSNNWVPVGQFITGGPIYTGFGFSLALNSSGDTVVIGAPFVNNSGGEVGVYKNSGGAWALQSNILSGASDEIGFGICVAMDASGGKIIVGDYQSDGGFLNTGSAIVYKNDDLLSTLEILFSKKTVIFPNPNNGTFQVSFTEHQDRVTLDVFDVLGRRVVQQDYFDTKNITINENLKAGIYLVRITGRHISETVRVVVE